ncbi:TetR family transcriptional regulator [Mycobacterium syngnathidarum]
MSIRAARLAAGLSMRAFGEMISVSAATVCAIENGSTGVSVARLNTIAAALGTTPARILSADEPVAQSARRPKGLTTQPESEWRVFPPLDTDVVLSGAIDCFVETGYHGTSMRTLAARIGVGVSSIYDRYADKQQLLVRILDVTMAELRWRTDAARNEATTSLQEVALLVEALALFHTYRRKLAFIGASEMRSLEGTNRRRITQSRDRMQYVLDEAIEQASLDGYLHTDHARAAGRAITTMCTSLPQWFRSGGPLTAEDVASAYVEFALFMLGAEPTAAVK